MSNSELDLLKKIMDKALWKIVVIAQNKDGEDS